MTEEIEPTAIQVRQMEVDSYTTNIDNYTNILSTLNGVWDNDLLHLKNVESQEASRQCPMDRLERLAELQQYENVSGLIRTEILEKTKSQAILNAMLSA